MARQQDRRVQRTRKMLREALMALILEEGYDEISIQDITEKANLGRATFYLHFRDKDELLLEVMDQLVVIFFEQVPQGIAAQWHLEDTKSIVKLFDFAAEHHDLYRILTIGRGGITAARQLHSSIAENIKVYLQSEQDQKGTEPEVPIDFIANHLSGALLATIYWWLESDLPYSSEEMAAMFQRINLLDRQRWLGVAPAEEPEEANPEQDKRKRRGKNNEQPSAQAQASDNESNAADPSDPSDDQAQDIKGT